MPQFWNNILVVTKEELVPAWYATENTLNSEIQRYKSKDYGIKRVQKGGNGRMLLIEFDSLNANIQAGLGDPRKVQHILERYYRVNGEAVEYFTSKFQFPDGSYLDTEFQERYITNASVLTAVLKLRTDRERDRQAKGEKTKAGLLLSLANDAGSFNEVLRIKHKVQHTLPAGDKQFGAVLSKFEKMGFGSLVSGKHKNTNPQVATDETIELLNRMFAEKRTKPTATEVGRQYNAFLNGYLEITNMATGEFYLPSDFKPLSERTVRRYLSQWENKIATHGKRSGDRQKFMQAFKPYHSLERPKFSNSIISIDDRQPPFKGLDGKRPWFYNAIDLGSEAFVCWVYGKSKEGIILEFYRQLVRNYAAWGLQLPAELECEMSLNSSFTETFLREGAMFQYVKMEANNARGKRIEAYYKPLRYKIEKKRQGWLARPHALSEANQQNDLKIPQLPFDDIIKGCLQDIEDWNNAPHSVHKDKTRWDVFVEMQNPNIRPTNYKAILPHIGHYQPTSCNVGIIHLQGREFLLGLDGKVALGENLIGLMKQAEGKELEVYWLDDVEGNVLKAHAYIGTQFICEIVQKPKYQRAKIERTDEDLEKRSIISAYVSTIEAYGRTHKKTLDDLLIIDKTPKPAKSFVMRELQKPTKELPETGTALPELPISESFDIPSRSFVKPLYGRF